MIAVGPGRTDTGTVGGPVSQARRFGLPVDKITRYGLVHLLGELTEHEVAIVADQLLIDPVGQWWRLAGRDNPAGQQDPDGESANDVDSSATSRSGVSLVIETGLRPGVTDREGAELVRAANELGIALQYATVATRWVIESAGGDGDDAGDGSDALSESQIIELANRVLHNEVIERWTIGVLAPAFADQSAASPATETIAIRDLDDEGLAGVNVSRRLGLDPEEMIVIRDHFRELGRDPRDAEMETLAQTWSEHCAHKTFSAQITVRSRQEAGQPAIGQPIGTEPIIINSLMKSYLRTATDTINAPWVRSAFVDNAGILDFEDGWEVAIKAETHNHPSALEPFGGSNTGVGGVVRDILGVSAKPIAVTDILCFGDQDIDPQDLPTGVLHPARVREGVIAGVGDYGNKIGVPNIAGAVVHDRSYTTTPLVFAGCLGLLPAGSNPTNAQPGDSIVVFGGAVGRDGVGGATFSSQTMGVETADIAGSSVQIGDPIVEKGLIDVMMAARDAKLYSAVTDCGAGGLSSAVGEMAETLGAEVDLQLVPRKYPGLAPWEVWLSEAQERMVVASADPAPLIALAERFGVGVCVIGRFTGKGRLIVKDGADDLIDLDCAFLHGCQPQRQMEAIAVQTDRPGREVTHFDSADALLRLLAHPSIRSNEDIVRTFDHEILGGTLVRPFGGPEGDGPADGTVIIPPGTSGNRGIALGIGVNCVLGNYDPEAMAWHVVDEAVRNAIIAGADPDELSLLDNFSWGDPTDPETLGALVAAVKGCHDAAVAFGAPFVSGKDSLYNVFVKPDGTPDPVTPTLVITVMGIVKDLDVVPLTGVVEAGNDVWLVGPAAGALGGSHLDQVLGSDFGGDVPAAEPGAVARHQRVASAIAAGLVRSAHDLSEGGLAVAAAEWAFAGRLGLALDVSESAEVLFGEGSGRYLLEVIPEDSARLRQLIPDAVNIGVVHDEPLVVLGDLAVSLDQIAQAWTGHHPDSGHLDSGHPDPGRQDSSQQKAGTNS